MWLSRGAIEFKKTFSKIFPLFIMYDPAKATTAIRLSVEQVSVFITKG